MNPAFFPLLVGLLALISYVIGIWMGRRDHERSCPQVDANEILSRVFPPAEYDAVREAWLDWYQPDQWLHPSRALGAFIGERLERREVELPHMLRQIESRLSTGYWIVREHQGITTCRHESEQMVADMRALLRHLRSARRDQEDAARWREVVARAALAVDEDGWVVLVASFDEQEELRDDHADLMAKLDNAREADDAKIAAFVDAARGWAPDPAKLATEAIAAARPPHQGRA